MQMKFGTKLIATLAAKDKPYEVRDTELPGFLIRVQPSGVQSYYCEYRNGQNLKQRVKLGRVDHLTLSQARDEAKKVLGSVAQGLDPAKDRKRQRLMTLKAFVQGDYGDWAKANHKRGDETVERLLARFEEFHEIRLDEITAWKVEKWINDRKKAGREGSTVNRNVGMLKACLSRAVEWKLIENHPLISIKAQRVDQSGIVRYLTSEELTRLYAALDAREHRIVTGRNSGNVWRIQRGIKTLPELSQYPFADYLKPMVLLSLNLGTRQGELFHAKWSDVNFGNRTIAIRGQISKSGKTRHIPLNQTALNTFRKWKEVSPESELIFPGRTGDVFNNVKKAWAKLLIDAQVSNFRWHDMRHHFASQLIMRGVDLNTVRELLGHSDIKMTLRYAHLSPRVMAEAVARLDESKAVEFNYAN
ncbi:MAG: tyrosine-type recombinase/integrase [Bdellovibrionota bacterium]